MAVRGWLGGYSSIVCKEVSMYVCSVGGCGGGGGGGRTAAHIHSFHRSQVGAGEPSGAGAGKSKSRAAVPCPCPCPCYYPHPSVRLLCYVCMYVCRVRERGRSSAPCSMESGSIPAGVQWFLCCATSCESSCCDGTAKYVAAAAGTRTCTHSLSSDESRMYMGEGKHVC